MSKPEIGKYKYTQVNNELDILKLPLIYNLFGINNRVYCNLGSYEISEEYKKNNGHLFTEEELKLNCLVRLFELHISCRRQDDSYRTIKKWDFKDLLKIIEDNIKSNKYESIYVMINDTDKAPNYLLPLNSNVIRNASNYAFQEIENIKFNNFFMDLNLKLTKQFVDAFLA